MEGQKGRHSEDLNVKQCHLNGRERMCHQILLVFAQPEADGMTGRYLLVCLMIEVYFACLLDVVIAKS
jgi:hypothetical protein